MASVAASTTRMALKRRDRVIVELLEKLQRCRPLAEEETVLLERVVQRTRPKRQRWYWHPDEDRKIKDLMARRRRRRIQPKLFQRNDEVRLLAIQLGRTEWAVRRRMERLRKCSRGTKKAKG